MLCLVGAAALAPARLAAQIPGGSPASWLLPAMGRQAPPPDSAAPQDTSALGIAFRGRFELKVDQLKNQRCTAGDIGNPFSGCAGGFPTPFVDQQFALKAGGPVSQRVHMNVDYNSEREFNANNDIRIWYEGQASDVLQRVEIGNVTLDAPASRFITAAIPANAFGLQARATAGGPAVGAGLARRRRSAPHHKSHRRGLTPSRLILSSTRAHPSTSSSWVLRTISRTQHPWPSPSSPPNPIIHCSFTAVSAWERRT